MFKPRICIIAHYASGAMFGGSQGHVGGVERQTSLTARWLAERGYEVSLLVYNEGQPADTVVDGVRVISMCKKDEGLPGLRFLWPRTTSLFAAMKGADANIYYHNCAEYFTGWAAFWCQRNKRKFVYSTAHDFDCTASLPALTKWYERVLYKYGIRRADKMIVQTEFQRQLLKKSFGLDSVALPMPCPGPTPDCFEAPEFPSKPRVVWVGRADPQKRLEWLLDIAEQIPEIQFEVAAANISDSPYVTSVVARAKAMTNVRWLGPVKRADMPDVYRNALCLCSTSIHEGFPNTFLESWSYGTPLVTTFDPDGLVAAKEMGVPIASVAEGVQAIRSLVSSSARWKTMSRNSRMYYEANHMVDTAIGRFEREFVSLLANAEPVADGTSAVRSESKAQALKAG